jgi:hypothetical protein
LCQASVSNWSLLQLTALATLAESREKSQEFYSRLAELTGIELFENDPSISFETNTVIAFSRAAGKLAVGLPGMEFAENLGIYLENSLPYYVPNVMDLVVPFYGIASNFFLDSLLSSPTQTLTSGILGPNRISEQKLNDAIVSVTRELEVVSEVLGALGLSAERPVIVGHGANGLIMKALSFMDGSDPWRIAFESPMLSGSPMATMARVLEINATRSRLMNFYSEGSFYARDDEAALMNNRFPKYAPHNPVIPPHAFETFCFAVAACGDDPLLDHLCQEVWKDKNFENLCDELGRPRNHRPA